MTMWTFVVPKERGVIWMEPILDDILIIQKKLVPELMQVFLRRYEVLKVIASHEPIGRRNLSSILGIGEKIVRTEIAQLQERMLISVKNQGMYITNEGLELLEHADYWIHKIKGLDDIEKELAKLLSIKRVIIASNEINDDPFIIQETGKKSALYLKSIISEGMIIGITGGSTMAAIAKEMPKYNYKNKNITIVPARGGLGVDVEMQANNIAALLAEKLNCTYKLLHISENLSKELLESLKQYPEIKETVDYIDKIDALVFGIGRADIMATRRNLDEDKIKDLLKKGAVAEAFGFYFDQMGKIVDSVNTVGISLEQYNKLRHIIGAASGVEKAEAIMAVSKLNPNLVLIIDENLARAVLKIHKKSTE